MTKPIPTQSGNRTRAGGPVGTVSEMFCSVQGEGLFIGERQIFVRTAGCAATCSWCDTVYSKVQTPRFVVHAGPGSETRHRPNPVGLDDVLDELLVVARENAPVASVSITGGEPLEQPQFVGPLARALRERGLRVHLETAGLHADALRSVIDHVDVIAMDVKLPSATGIEHWDAHREFLSAMRGTAFDPEATPAPRTVFAKVVVDLKASEDEIGAAARLIAAASPRIPLILQPESETLFGRSATRPRSRALLDLIDAGARAAGAVLETVRVIPQTHKVLHVR